MPERRMYRYLVPIDDQAHGVGMSSTADPVAVAVAAADNGLHVEFWAECLPQAPQARRVFQVFGTGHPLPEDARWVGTCARRPAGLVWHLYAALLAVLGCQALALLLAFCAAHAGFLRGSISVGRRPARKTGGHEQ